MRLITELVAGWKQLFLLLKNVFPMKNYQALVSLFLRDEIKCALANFCHCGPCDIGVIHRCSPGVTLSVVFVSNVLNSCFELRSTSYKAVCVENKLNFYGKTSNQLRITEGKKPCLPLALHNSYYQQLSKLEANITQQANPNLPALSLVLSVD